MTKSKKRNGDNSSDASPVKILKSELKDLQRDLRRTVRAYALGLETDLRKSAEAVEAFGPVDELSRESLHEVRDLTTLLRKRKLKPEKGRRKDLRKIDSLISDLQVIVRNGNGRSNQ